MPCGFESGVKGVRGVKVVKVKCTVGYCQPQIV